MVYLIDTYISSDIQIQKRPIHISDQIKKEQEEIDESEERRSNYMSARLSEGKGGNVGWFSAPPKKIFFNARKKDK